MHYKLEDQREAMTGCLGNQLGKNSAILEGKYMIFQHFGVEKYMIFQHFG